MAKIGKVQEVAVSDLMLYERNAKQHPEDQIQKIADSIREFGFISPVLIDDNKNVIAGHGRIEAARTLGMKTVPCVDISGLTEEQRRAYILADNRLTEMGGWNTTLLSEELKELSELNFDISLTGFGFDDIIIADDLDVDFTEDDLQEAAEEIKEPRIHRGEVWKLGRHRLMCGDSTNADDVAKLMSGKKASLLLTDPPYGVNYVGQDQMTIENDDLKDDELYHFLLAAFLNAKAHMKNGGSYYCWFSESNGIVFRKALEDAHLQVKQILIWVKDRFVLGRQDYQWRHEPCLYGWTEDGAHYFIDRRNFSTIFDDIDHMDREKAIETLKEISSMTDIIYEQRPSSNDLHPTMKPLNLFKKMIRNSSREGDIILDLFCGSGTTVLAAEEMKRTAYAMEFDPKYAEVIINRYEEVTGKKAVLLHD